MVKQIFSLSICFILFQSVLANQFKTEVKRLEEAWWKGDRSKFITDINSLIKKAKDNKNTWALGKAYYLSSVYISNAPLANGESQSNRYNNILKNISISDSVLLSGNFIADLAINYSYRTFTYNNYGEYEKSFNSLSRADSLIKIQTSLAARAWIHYRKGTTYQSISQPHLAIKEFPKAIILFDSLEMPLQSARIYLNLGSIFLSQGKLKTSKYYFNKAEIIARKHNAYHLLNLLFYYTFSLNINNGDLARAQELTDSITILEDLLNGHHNQYVKAIHSSKILKARNNFKGAKAIIVKEIKRFSVVFADSMRWRHLAVMYSMVAGYDIKLRNWNAALDTLNTAAVYARKAEEIYLQRDISNSLYKVNKFLKNTSTALKNLENYRKLSDSLIDIEKAKQSAQLEVFNKTNELEKDKVELNNKIRIQTLEDQNQKVLFTSIFVGFILIIGIVIFYSIVKNQKQKNENLISKQKLLRSQMNPHFIFNTLSAVQSEILEGEKLKASALVAKFGKLIRDVLEGSIENYISLKQELRLINNYLSVQQTRLNNRFYFEVGTDIKSNIDNIEVSPMLLQPFIENAVEHGVKNIKDGYIEVFIQEKKGKLIFEISDNGNGYSKLKNTSHKSQAISITNQRLQELNNDKSDQINITSSQNGGTCISFSIPLIIA